MSNDSIDEYPTGFYRSLLLAFVVSSVVLYDAVRRGDGTTIPILALMYSTGYGVLAFAVMMFFHWAVQSDADSLQLEGK